MKKSIVIIIVLVIAGFGAGWFLSGKAGAPTVSSFEECVAAGNPVMESFPRQCRHDGVTYVENIGNELEKANLIRIDSPRPNQAIKSPLTITGEARGSWYFEASFPVTLTDWDGKIVAQGIATAKEEWMTTEFVPFEAKLSFTINAETSDKGILILRKDNPSGLPEHDDALVIPVVFAGAGGAPIPVACTMEAKLCPDGSYVGRTGPRCEFTPCPGLRPSGILECKKDSDCPSSKYICEETQGTGTACPSNDPTCVPTHTTIAGECKLKSGNQCKANADCAAGNLCHKNICASPVGRECNGPDDTSCGADFECEQGCGPPVVRYPDDTPTKYFCELKGYERPCPICLAKSTLIDTPAGEIAVQDLKVGDAVWTTDSSGKRVAGIVVKTSKTPVPPSHQMAHLVFEDGRELFVSPGHLTTDGRTVGELKPGDIYDGARVLSADLTPYAERYTYDILSSGDTGFYFANDILLGSTLH